MTVATDPRKTGVNGGSGTLLAARPVIAVVGDSRAANHISTTNAFSGRGPVAWAVAKLNGRLRLNATDIYGIASTLIKDNNGSGNSAQSQLSGLTRFYDYIAVISGINDVFASATSAKMISDMSSLIAEIQGKGAVPVLFTEIVPTTATAGQRTVIDRYNSWLRAYSLNKNIVLVDAYAATVDWTSSTNQPRANYLYDGLHFGPVGAEAIGDLLVTLMGPRLPLAGWLAMYSREDAYDATNSPYGNLLGTAGALAASGGSNRDSANNAGSASTGTVAAGCKLFKTNGQLISVVGSVTTGTATFNSQSLTIPVQNIAITSGGTGTQLCQFQLPDITTNFAAGDNVVLSGWINVKTATGLVSFTPYVQERNVGGSTVQTTSSISGYSTFAMTASAKAFFFESPVMTLTAAATTLRGLLDISVDGATANIDCDIGMVSVRKVDPLLLV